VLSGREYPKEGATLPLYQRVANDYKKRGLAVVDVPNIGPVKLDARAVSRSIYHGLNKIKGIAFAAVPEVLLFGKILKVEPLRGSREGLVYYVGAPVSIAVVMVKKDRLGARMYLHSVVPKKRVRQSAYPSGGARPEEQNSDTHSADAGSVWKVLRDLYAVN